MHYRQKIKLRFWGLLAAALLHAWSAQALESPLISTHAYASLDISAFSEWAKVIPRYNLEHENAKADCHDPDSCKMQEWENLLHSLHGKKLMEQLSGVNRFFNQFPYVLDQDNYDVEDYWATPYELMHQGGDCEDYAIAKYISLRRLGVPESIMRIVVVQDMDRKNILHAILEVNVKGVPYILDNQAHDVTQAAKVFHYRPIYAINADKWWSFK